MVTAFLFTILVEENTSHVKLTVGRYNKGDLLQSPRPRKNSDIASGYFSKCGDESSKHTRLSSAKVGLECSTSGDGFLSAPPCLVTLNAGARIATVAAGGRHMLALSASDVGQVWGWRYGGEGQLGLGSRIHEISTPHPIPCIQSAAYSRDWPSATSKGIKNLECQVCKVTGSHVTAIACGGHHSAVVSCSHSQYLMA